MITKDNNSIKIEHGPERPGDVRHSLADIALAHQRINYTPVVDLESGIEVYVDWARRALSDK
jgi:nucleoside-diphosphate-sugar epimerase